MFTYDNLLHYFCAWAETEHSLRAAVIIGSRARLQDHPADEWSDLDVILYFTDPQPYIHPTGWLESFGEVWLSFLEHTPDGLTWERRVMYAGGLDVDFVIENAHALEEMLAHSPSPDDTDIFRRGARPLVDKDGTLTQFLGKLPLETSRVQLPSEADFLNDVQNFWYHTVWTAKHLRRGELWFAKHCCDVYLKELLRRMLEWHARAAQGASQDTWMRGRFLDQWADPCAVLALREAYAHYNPQEVARALVATMDLYRWLAEETSLRWGYAYPQSGDRQTTELTEKLLVEGRLRS